jgi:predicted O-methyltransferase YrrM
MSRIILFGAGIMCRRYLNSPHCEIVVAIVDNNPEFVGRYICSHKIISPDKILDYDFDKIIITLSTYGISGSRQDVFRNISAMFEQLRKLNIPESKIFIQDVQYLSKNNKDGMVDYDNRAAFLKHFAENNSIKGEVAECGVFWGDFSSLINRFYPNKTLYLFDTFSGFNENDFDENLNEYNLFFNTNEAQEKSYNNEQFALLKCLHREQIVVKKGRIPNTFEGLEDEIFAFVSLDMDIYNLQLSALEFFIPRMGKGGVIVAHNYYTPYLPGTKKSLEEVSQKYDIVSFPIGDNCSIAIMPR